MRSKRAASGGATPPSNPAPVPPAPATAVARLRLRSTLHREGAAAPDQPGDGERGAERRSTLTSAGFVSRATTPEQSPAAGSEGELATSAPDESDERQFPESEGDASGSEDSREALDRRALAAVRPVDDPTPRGLARCWRCPPPGAVTHRRQTRCGAHSPRKTRGTWCPVPS